MSTPTPVMSMRHRSEVLEVWQPTPTTRAIRLALPHGFRFQTSQAVRLVLATPTGDAARPMSIASGHTRPYLEFAARASTSDFKRAFFALSPGDPVRIVGPAGQFFLERDRPVVMIAGGIGITPFRSMLQTVSDEGGPRTPILLVYANREPIEVAFKHELDELAARTFGIQIDHSVSRATTPWSHRIGAVDREALAAVVGDRPDAVYYVAGPGAFVRDTGISLASLGVPPSAIRMEMFRGYLDDEAPRPAGPASWDVTYRQMPVEQMPWFYDVLDPDLARALDAHAIARGRFLDAGTGPGTQAIRLAERGFDVIGIDISPAAIDIADARARAAGVGLELRVGDVLAELPQVDHAFDRGCFHVLPADRHTDYVHAIHAAIRPGGMLFLKCFSDEEGGAPNQFAPEAIARLFGPRFDVLSIERTEIQGALAHGPRALFCVLRRV